MKKFAHTYVVGKKIYNYLAALVGILLLAVVLKIIVLFALQNKRISNDMINEIVWPTAIAIIFTSLRKIAPREERHLLSFGEETNEWATAGWFFTFHLYSLDSEKETGMYERDEIAIEGEGPDMNGKLTYFKFSGQWVRGTSDAARKNFKLIDSKAKAEKNFGSMLLRAGARAIASRDYWKNIIGKDLLPSIWTDKTFLKELEAYGIEFPILDFLVKSGDAAQDNLNAQYNKLLGEALDAYPKGYKFKHQEFQEIDDRINTRLGRAKRIITNSAVLGRYEIDSKP